MIGGTIVTPRAGRNKRLREKSRGRGLTWGFLRPRCSCEGFSPVRTIRRGRALAAGADMEAQERLWRERGLHEAVLAGDEAAWRHWYEECYAGLYAYVLWRCGGLHDRADETVGEVWLTAVRRLATFDPAAGCFSAWLRGIAANL